MPSGYKKDGSKLGFQKGHSPYISFKMKRAVSNSNKKRRIHKEKINYCKYCNLLIKTNVNNNKTFCSLKHYHLYRLQNQEKYIFKKHGLYTKKTRSFLKEMCKKCSSINNLCLHHKNRDRKNNKKYNLRTLCKKCHTQEHSIEISNGLKRMRAIKLLK